MLARRCGCTRLQPGRQGGVALAIVLWFLAGMSLLVAGIVSQARVDTQMAQLHVARAKSEAAGDGAVQLMLAELLLATAAPGEMGRDLVGNYRLGESEISVRLVPVNGLIDIGSASPQLLLTLFAGAGLDEDAARQLTENVIQSRTVAGRRAGQATIQLDAPEDLLRIPGMSRSLLDALRDFIVVGEPARGDMDWAAAPDEILAVMRQMNGARAESARAGGGGGLARAYRADAVLRYGGRSWLRRLWIEMAASPGSSLPWKVVRREPSRIVRDDEVMSRVVDAG